jgi:predicted RNA binding protein YcfA (HicA-like mRNA interferase family)
MSQLEKLYRRFLDGQQLDFVEFERLLKAFGYEQQRQAGSHRAWVNKVVRDTRILTPQGKHANPYQLRQFRRIVEQYGLAMGGEGD